MHWIIQTDDFLKKKKHTHVNLSVREKLPQEPCIQSHSIARLYLAIIIA